MMHENFKAQDPLEWVEHEESELSEARETQENLGYDT